MKWVLEEESRQVVQKRRKKREGLKVKLIIILNLSVLGEICRQKVDSIYMYMILLEL